MPKTTLFKIALAITVFIFMAGCAATSSLKEMHEGWDPWIGQNIDSLIARWGAPCRIAASDENTVYSWFYVNGSKVSYGRYIAAIMFARHDISSLESRDYRCRMNWTVDKKDLILTWQNEGQCLVIK